MAADVLFIHPGNQKKTFQALSKGYTAVATPVWTALLAQSARAHGYRAVIYDTQVEGWDADAASNLLSRHNPELAVVMVYGHTPLASTQTMPAAGAVAKDLKKANRSMPVIMGGIHPSALPERTLREEAVDYVVAGEGVYTINGLLDCMKGKRNLAEVPGLWRRSGEEAVFSSPAPLVRDLDAELDGYAWDLLPDFSRYRAHTMHCFDYFERSARDDFSDVRSPYVTMNTSLGCPYNCNYCCINSIFVKPGIRYWSEAKVFSWLDHLHSRGVRNIRLDDELFILSPKRVERLCDMIIESGHDFNFWVYGRVDTVRKDVLKKLKRAGFNWICLGIESANESVRANVNKRIRGDIGDVVRMIRKEGIRVHGNFMFGLPEDTMESMEETLQLAIRLDCEFINFYSAMALPGSALYQDALKNPDWLPETWDGFSQFSRETKPMPTRHVTAARVLAFRDEAFLRYMEREDYLRMLSDLFGPSVRKHVEQMLTIKLDRRLTELS